MSGGSARSHADLLQEIAELRAQLRNLLTQNGLDGDDLLCLAVLRRAPLAIWAADRDCRIRLWTDGAARLYGYSAQEAVGQDFVDLFVDAPEQEDARRDCRRVIDADTEFHNFLAGDKTANGDRRLLLTNCFRVRDSLSGQYLQAEIGVDISDLEESRTRFQRLREVGVALRTSRDLTMQAKRSELVARVGQARATRLTTLLLDERDAEHWAVKTGQPVPTTMKTTTADWKARCDALLKAVERAKTLDELSDREQDVRAIEDEVAQ